MSTINFTHKSILQIVLSAFDYYKFELNKGFILKMERFIKRFINRVLNLKKNAFSIIYLFSTNFMTITGSLLLLNFFEFKGIASIIDQQLIITKWFSLSVYMRHV